REGLSPGDPDRSCPEAGSRVARLTMLIVAHAKLFQRQQAELAVEVPRPQLAVVVVVLPLEFHGPQTHADPRVELLEHPATSREAGGEVVRRASDDRVQLRDRLRV